MLLSRQMTIINMAYRNYIFEAMFLKLLLITMGNMHSINKPISSDTTDMKTNERECDGSIEKYAYL